MEPKTLDDYYNLYIEGDDLVFSLLSPESVAGLLVEAIQISKHRHRPKRVLDDDLGYLFHLFDKYGDIFHNIVEERSENLTISEPISEPIPKSSHYEHIHTIYNIDDAGLHVKYLLPFDEGSEPEFVDKLPPGYKIISVIAYRKDCITICEVSS